ncbi:MAG: hypothetical protein CO133_02590, partial [Candidatus Komeilibacteria bacterium CG_4_9_14_3_um_filter_37_5]
MLIYYHKLEAFGKIQYGINNLNRLIIYFLYMPVSKKKKVIADGVGQQGNWLYSNIVKKHFFQPQNIMMP